MPTEGELVLRLLLAAALAGILGVERELAEQPAGFRTHLLVGLGSALFAVVSAFGFQAIVAGEPPGEVRVDVSRVAANIVVGIGFLGGGAILKYGATVRGLTTAANLWVTAAVGTAAGLGMHVLAAVTTGIALLALSSLRPLRATIRRYALGHHELTIHADLSVDVDALLAGLREMGVHVGTVHVETEATGSAIFVVARLPKGVDPDQVVEGLRRNPHVRTAGWTS